MPVLSLVAGVGKKMQRSCVFLRVVFVKAHYMRSYQSVPQFRQDAQLLVIFRRLFPLSLFLFAFVKPPPISQQSLFFPQIRIAPRRTLRVLGGCEGANFESGVIFDTPLLFLSHSYLSHTSATASLAYIRLPEDETDFG